MAQTIRYDHIDPAYAEVLESTDEVAVTYDAQPNEDGSTLTVRRTVWKRAYHRRHQHILWVGDVVIIPRDQVPGFVQDIVSCVVV